MELTSAALWLNDTFGAFDHVILEFFHNLAVLTGGYLNWLFRLISLFGDNGIFLIILSIVLMFFKNTRKIGVCMFGAIGLGGIITNLFLKETIARPRPYMLLSEYKQWWNYVGSVSMSDFSFPSGHCTAICASMMSIIFFTENKKKYLFLIFILLMGISRIYLMVHYPSDVLFGFIIGFISAVVAYYITKFIFFILDKYNIDIDKIFTKKRK